MKIVFNQSATADVVIYPVCTELTEFAALKDYTVAESATKWMEVTTFYQPTNHPDIVLVGLGERDKLTIDKIRQAAGTVGRKLEKERAVAVQVDFTYIRAWCDQQTVANVCAAWVEGWVLGTYVFDQYKSKQRSRTVTELIFSENQSAEHESAVKQANMRATGMNLARDLGNEPPNHLRPLILADRVKQHFSSSAVQVKVHSGETLQQMQMNGIQTVGKGSQHPPALIEMHYCTDSTLPLIALVGKGITFDTGGISLKKSRDLSDMRLDMAGAAAVIGALEIIVQSGQAANVIALIATAENSPDGEAMLPGEVITYKNGVSVQVGNTDAEGRLVLADALIRAHELGASEAVDIATLTGACVVALGDRVAGLWGTDEALLEQLQQASSQTGDKLWPMPLEEDYEASLSSVYADVSNISKGPYGGAITAALFLKKFAHPDLSWAHIDMAGPMEASRTSGYMPAGATGYGARLLAEYVLKREQQ